MIRNLFQQGKLHFFMIYHQGEFLAHHTMYYSLFILVRNSNAIWMFNTLRPRQDGRHFADDIFTCIFFNENCYILIKFSLKFLRKGPIDNNPALVQIMAWHRSGDKPLSKPMMISLPTHICVTRPQWVKLDQCYLIRSWVWISLWGL